MKVEDIKKVLVIGAGTMGEQIAIQCAINGYDVALYDVKQEALDRSMQKIPKTLSKIAAGGLTNDAAAALKRISATADAAKAASDADIVSESIPEDPELKGRVFRQFHELCPDHTIFTTNTSSLVPSMFAAQCGRPGRLIALHFHPPVWMATVADVMPHPGTEPEVTEITRHFAERIGQAPILLTREHPGFVFNTMLMSWIDSALRLVTRDICSIEDVDRSWMGVMFAPMGPFGVMDFIGLDTCYKVTEFWARKRGGESAERMVKLLKEKVDRGDLGMKSGKGFYTYPNPAYAEADFVKKKRS